MLTFGVILEHVGGDKLLFTLAYKMLWVWG